MSTTTTHFGPASQAMTLEQIGRGYDAGTSKEGNMSTTKSANVVPMARGVPTTTTTPPPTTWPCPPYPPPGCAPPACPPSSLMQCYCDVQSAMQFISTIMIDLINNNPDVTQAIIAAIEKSGSALPLIGVTNGTPAQPGQVGEYVQILQQVPYTTAQGQVQSVTMGILQPGDWLTWCSMGTTTLTSGLFMQLNPQPVGFTGTFANEMAGTGMAAATALIGPPCQALISVPTLVVIQITTNLGAVGTAGTADIFFNALRVR